MRIIVACTNGDLKPKAYSYIMVRIFVVAVLSWVLDAIIPEGGEVPMLLLAFQPVKEPRHVAPCVVPRSLAMRSPRLSRQSHGQTNPLPHPTAPP